MPSRTIPNNARPGAQNGRWKGGERIPTSHGYVRVRVGQAHPLADSEGYAYEHLIVWLAAGRPMPGPAELLHHKSEDKTDNRLGNLELITRAEHSRMHAAKQLRQRGRFARQEAAERAVVPCAG